MAKSDYLREYDKAARTGADLKIPDQQQTQSALADAAQQTQSAPAEAQFKPVQPVATPMEPEPTPEELLKRADSYRRAASDCEVKASNYQATAKECLEKKDQYLLEAEKLAERAEAEKARIAKEAEEAKRFSCKCSPGETCSFKILDAWFLKEDLKHPYKDLESLLRSVQADTPTEVEAIVRRCVISKDGTFLGFLD